MSLLARGSSIVLATLLLIPAVAADEAPAGEERPGWIQEQVRVVEEGNDVERKNALERLIRNDKEGDCTKPLIALLPEHRKDVALLAAVIRVLGRDQLLDAAPPIAAYLTHRDEAVRGNAAVSLEYIGSRDKAVIGALRKAADKEKDVGLANHIYRALGRCGVGDSKVRAALLKKSGSAKSEFASYGPIIGLAYFEGDAKAARGIEKILKKIGVPGSRRGGGQNTVKRGVLCWTLAWIGDKKSGPFMRKELLPKLKNVKAFWVEGLREFYTTVARKCEGQQEAMTEIEQAVEGFVRFAMTADLGRYGAETRGLMDEYRRGRDMAVFKPRGDYLLDEGDP
jgi:hypothetical protein